MTIFSPGSTCWRTARAGRTAFLIDNEAYFTAVFDAFQKARRSILLHANTPFAGGSDALKRV